MATRVIFSGDVTVSLNTSPRQFRLVNADFSLEDVENTPEIILNINGSSKSFSYSGLYPYDSNRYWWTTQGVHVAFTYYISSGLLAIVDPAFEMPNTMNVEVIADISKKVITYSASQNGGSIYDNLKELYSSVTGEDAKGHNPSEVIDELKGKLGGGGTGSDELIFVCKNSYFTCNKTIREILSMRQIPKITIQYWDGDSYSELYCPVLAFSFFTDSDKVIICVSEGYYSSDHINTIACIVFTGEVNNNEDTWAYNYKDLKLSGD